MVRPLYGAHCSGFQEIFELLVAVTATEAGSGVRRMPRVLGVLRVFRVLGRLRIEGVWAMLPKRANALAVPVVNDSFDVPANVVTIPAIKQLTDDVSNGMATPKVNAVFRIIRNVCNGMASAIVERLFHEAPPYI